MAWKDSIPRPILVINKDISHKQLPFISLANSFRPTFVYSSGISVGNYFMNDICKESLLHLGNYNCIIRNCLYGQLCCKSLGKSFVLDQAMMQLLNFRKATRKLPLQYLKLDPTKSLQIHSFFFFFKLLLVFHSKASCTLSPIFLRVDLNSKSLVTLNINTVLISKVTYL